MAKLNAVGKKEIGKGFSNDLLYKELVYDVAAGDSLTFNDQIVIGSMTTAAVIHNSYVFIEDAVTSGGSATVKIGDTDASESFLSATAVGSLTANAVLNETTGQGKYLAAGKEIIVVPLVADLLAGKIRLKLVYSNS